MSAASCWNCSFLATKSVSQLSWIIAPSAAATRPLLAVRSAPRLAALAAPLTRSNSAACVEVAVGLLERLLRVHHAGAGGVPELLDVCGGEVRHFSLPLVLRVAAHVRLRTCDGSGDPHCCGRRCRRTASGLLACGVVRLGGRGGLGHVFGDGLGRVLVDGLGCRARQPARSRRRMRSASVSVAASRWPGPRSAVPPSSSCSHSASGSSVARSAARPASRRRRPRPARAIRPSATASATTRVSSVTERIASSLPGIV